jgi:hypothetical protein
MCGKDLAELTPEEQAEANQEAEELWGASSLRSQGPPPGFARVCDDCFQQINPEDHPDKYAEALEELHGGKPHN